MDIVPSAPQGIVGPVGFTLRVSPAFFLHLRSLSTGQTGSALGTRLLRSWESWERLVRRSEHAAALLHGRGSVIAERAPPDSLEPGGFFFAVRLQREGGRLSQQLTINADTIAELPPSLVECWAAQAGLPLQPSAILEAATKAAGSGAAGNAAVYRHAFVSHRSVLDAPTVAELEPALFLPTQAGHDSAAGGGGGGAAFAPDGPPPKRVFKVVRVASVATTLESEPLPVAAWLPAHPRIEDWALGRGGYPPAFVWAPVRQEAGAADGSGGAAAPDVPVAASAAGRKRRRDDGAAAALQPLPAPPSLHAPDAFAPLFRPLPGDVIVTVNGCRPSAADQTRQLLYGVHQVCGRALALVALRF